MDDYVAILALPLLYWFAPNPTLLLWLWRHGQAPIPGEVANRVRRDDTVVVFVNHAALICLIVALSLHRPERAAQLRSLLQPSAALVMIGIAAGIFWLGGYLAIHHSTQSQHRAPSAITNPALYWDVRVWGALTVTSAFVEEIWRAYCILILSDSGSARAIAIVSVVFGVAHIGSLGRIISATAFGFFAGLLILKQGSVWSAAIAHLILNLGVYRIARMGECRQAD